MTTTSVLQAESSGCGGVADKDHVGKDGDDDGALGLDDLFTNTDYVTSTVRIPVAPKGTDENNCDTLLELSLECSRSAATDFDLTGQVIWPVSILLAHYVASLPGQELLSGVSLGSTEETFVVELGAGCGLPGIIASCFASKVVLTDGNDIVLELLGRNSERRPSCCSSRTTATDASCETSEIITSTPPVSQEKEMADRGASASDKQNGHCCTATKLIWGDPHHVRHVLDLLGLAVPQPRKSRLVVLGADVVQWPAVVEPLLHTVKALLWNQSRESAFILGLVRRAFSTVRLFFHTADQLGFSYRCVPHSGFLQKHEETVANDEAFQRCEVWEFKLKEETQAQEPPLLLEENGKTSGNADLTLGEGFHHTAYLPY